MENNTIAMYLRLSDEDDNLKGNAMSESIAHQRSLIMDYISNRPDLMNCPVIEFADDGYTGTNFNRPEFQRMMKMVSAGQISTVITKDYSRLGRDYLEVGNYMEITFPMLGIRYISVNDHYDSNENNGATGGMSVALKNLVNAMYCRDASRKVRSAKLVLAKQGKYYASFAPYGYRKSAADKYVLEPDPETADVVRNIFIMAAEGKKYTEIAEELNKAGYESVLAYHDRKKVKRSHSRDVGKKLWSATTVMEILYNEVYLGKVINNKVSYNLDTGHKTVVNAPEDWIVVMNCHEPLVTEELFQKAHEMLNRKEYCKIEKPSWRRSLIRCGCCGKGMTKNGKKYYCSRTHFRVSREKIEKAVLETVRVCAAAELDKLDRETVKDDYSDIEREVKKLKASIKRVSHEKFMVYDEYTKGRLERAEMADRNEKLKKQIDGLQRSLEEKENMLCQAKVLKNEDIVDELGVLAYLQKFDRNVLDKFIQKVVVFDESRMEITWNTDDFISEMLSSQEGVILDGKYDKQNQ